MPAPIAVTGASGNAGQAVIAALRARGVPVRPLLREPVGDAVGFDFPRPDTFEAAVAG
ncbi:MAG: NmrA family NAD(P)-binding protein, partial [Myxococcales bacterium]|nr:NmrA family NAD(P)-binding protein [Myxococcales bacterium]